MYAIIKTGGKQYKAEPERFIDVEKLDAEVGAEVTFDGDTSARLTCTDKVVIRKAAKKTRLIKINQISFLEVLRTKMNGQ